MAALDLQPVTARNRALPLERHARQRTYPCRDAVPEDVEDRLAAETPCSSALSSARFRTWYSISSGSVTLSSRRRFERTGKRERGGRAGNRQDGKSGCRTGIASASNGSRATREAFKSTPGGPASSSSSARDAVRHETVRRTGMSKPTVWRRRDRFLAEGVDGLPRDATRPPGKKPIAEDRVKAATGLAMSPPGIIGEGTPGTGRCGLWWREWGWPCPPRAAF